MKHIARHCTPENAGMVVGADTPEDIKKSLNDYFGRYAAPVDVVEGDRRRRYCLNCGKEFDGFKQVLGMGVAFEWGLVHGEASCSGCGWPATGHHFIKDEKGAEICTVRNLFLLYHPDNVEQREGSADVA